MRNFRNKERIWSLNYRGRAFVLLDVLGVILSRNNIYLECNNTWSEKGDLFVFKW